MLLDGLMIRVVLLLFGVWICVGFCRLYSVRCLLV